MADAKFTRVCSCCRQEKEATPENFHAAKRAPDGCRAMCIVCRAADHAMHREERAQKRREHYQAHRDRLTATAKEFYQKNIEAQRAVALARHYRNRDLRLEQMQAWRAANLDEVNARRRPRSREAFRARYGVDVEFTLKHRLRALIRVTLNKGRDGVRMRELLGYGTEELRAHLERQFTSGMTWSRFLAGEIHVDHIIPVVHFSIESADSAEFRACWAVSNLRPMWAGENLAKGAKVLTLL